MSLKHIANLFGGKNRLRKFNLFMDYFEPNQFVRILDVGAQAKEYQRYSNILEKLYPYSTKHYRASH